MDAITVVFQDIDLVVQSFAGSVGSAILPAVLDVRAVVPDGVGAPPGALMVGGGISVKPMLIVCGRQTSQFIISSFITKMTTSLVEKGVSIFHRFSLQFGVECEIMSNG